MKMRLGEEARQEVVWFLNLSEEQRKAMLKKATPEQLKITNQKRTFATKAKSNFVPGKRRKKQIAEMSSVDRVMFQRLL
jgi:hypothetical protein